MICHIQMVVVGMSTFNDVQNKHIDDAMTNSIGMSSSSSGSDEWFIYHV